MKAQAAVIRYDGKRGTVWRIKFADADGRQVQETLGRSADGWTERKARAELRARLVAVDKDHYVRPVATGAEEFFREFIGSYPDAVGLKRTTRKGYRTIVERHLIPAFQCDLHEIDVAAVEKYVAKKRRDGLSGGSINRHLNLLHNILANAKTKKRITTNPVPDVTRPKEARRRWRILTPQEIGKTDAAFRELAAKTDDEVERVWIEQARVVFVTVIDTGMRRGELKGLRWRRVMLADPDGAVARVEETWVADAEDTPKSETSERDIALGQRVAAELFDHRARTAFAGDDDRVFCHPLTGGPLDHKRYAVTLRAALKRAGVDGYVRPFHDGRHTSITNGAKAGVNPVALMKRAGHSDFKTTQRYIDLAGETFRSEVEKLDARLWGTTGTNGGTNTADRALSAEVENPA
jgi:site-specific recombinase XerD